MTVTNNVAALARELRRVTDNMLNLPEVELARSWVNAWDAVEQDITGALEELAAAADGKRVPAWKIGQNQRIVNALETLSEGMQEALGEFASTIQDVTLPNLLEQVDEMQKRMARAQLPLGAAVGYTFTQADKTAVTAIVRRVTEQIVSPLLELPAMVDQAMRRELVRGVILGENPNKVAARIIQATKDQFTGGYNRATVITRTEMHDAQRSAAQAFEEANSDIISGWVWVAALDKRTCRSCIAMHGTIHKPSEQLIDHHRGRCVRAPLVRPLKELGMRGSVDDTPMQTGEEWFNTLPEGEKLKTLSGGAKNSASARSVLTSLENGDLKFSDLSSLKTHDGWRAARHATTFKELEKKAARNAS